MNSAKPATTFPTCAAVQRSASRGFTLIELLTVVGIIAVFAAIALPTIASRLRERRSANVAQQLAQTYRVARMRALGRGSAVLVRYDSSVAKMIMTREAIAGTAGLQNCALTTISSCTNPAGRWDDPTLYSEIDKFNPFSTTGIYELTRLEFLNAQGASKTQYDICFTPAGNAFWRDAFGDVAFQQLDAVPSIRVWSTDGSMQIGPNRFVYLLPNGVARLGI